MQPQTPLLTPLTCPLISVLRGPVYRVEFTFDTFDIPFDLLFIVHINRMKPLPQYVHTDKVPVYSFYLVDPNSIKSFELETLRIRQQLNPLQIS